MLQDTPAGNTEIECQVHMVGTSLSASLGEMKSTFPVPRQAIFLSILCYSLVIRDPFHTGMQWANPIETCFLKKLGRGWRKGSAGKRACCPRRGPSLIASTHTGWLITICNSSSRQTDTCVHTHWTDTQINKN